MSETALPPDAQIVYRSDQIQQALDSLATRLNTALDGEQVVALCVMNGGLIFSGQLLPRLSFDILIDYCHATRYRNTIRGNALQWLSRPQLNLKRQTVLILDDILDEGVTLQAIRDYCRQQGAARVLSAVLLEKQHQRRIDGVSTDFSALGVTDHYVFGFGMDYQGKYRNLDAIYSLGDNTCESA